jgi:EmrB/QacA subfamily drug resistance transporter
MSRQGEPQPGATGDASATGLRYASSRGRWVIAATVLGSGMASIDATAVGIALPNMGRELHASLGTLQWVVSGYTLTLGALLLPSGSLGDLLGRRRVFIVGVIWFALTSALCSVAPTATVLIVTRVLQGIGAALLTPGSLAIIEASFVPDDRARAVGAWSGLGGVATAAGPLLGGYLVSAASWRWIFLINVPVGAAVLLLAIRHIPESRDEDAPALDIPGAVLAVVALLGIVYGLIEGPTRGWTNAAVVVMLTIGILAGAGFVLVEHRSSHPMLPLSLFKLRQFSVTNAVTFVVYAGLGGALFLLPVALQVVAGYSPFESGIALLPLTAVMLTLSAQSGRLASRIGPRLQMTVGPLVVGAGLVLLIRSTTDTNYLTGVLPGVLVLALGLATTVAPLTTTALSALPDRNAGLASAVNNDVARIGSLIAVAVLPAMAGITGSSYLNADELARGFRTAMIVAGSWCALGGVLAGIGIRNPSTRLPADECLHCALDATPLKAAST